MKRKGIIQLIKLVLVISLLIGLYLILNHSSNHKKKIAQIKNVNKITKTENPIPKKIKPDLPVKQKLQIKEHEKVRTYTADEIKSTSFAGFFKVPDADLEFPPNMLEDDSYDPYDPNNLIKYHPLKCYTFWTYVFPVMVPRTVCF